MHPIKNIYVEKGFRVFIKGIHPPIRIVTVGRRWRTGGVVETPRGADANV